MLIDTHTHVNFNAFKDTADDVIQRSLSEQTWMIVVGADYKTSRRALDYANKYDKGVYAAAGLHPIHLFSMQAKGTDYDFITRGEEFNYDIYEKLARFEKVVAIGEVGLDYYHLDGVPDIEEVKRKQKTVFAAQLKLAHSLGLPVMIHCREAHGDMLEILKDFRKEYQSSLPNDKPWGVIHCFSGDEDLAWKYFSLGLSVSFTGLITFNRQWDDLIRKLPADKFMIETDSPYMTPEPLRGRTNEPSFVKYVAQRIAAIKNISTESVAEMTTVNARRLFDI
jgi:TatD DNase family protein